jgi:YD repeat-containing protein
VQDHLVAVTDAEGNTTAYAYSDRDLLTQEVSPVSGTTTHALNEHGELISTTDARAITVTRTVDEADRVTFVDYPGTDLDVTYAYGTNAAIFDLGRLVDITRNGTTVAYAYDRFGRVIQDGDLTYGYDRNGNRTSIGYPGGVAAGYTFDFADRESTLAVTSPAGAHPVVTASSYLPSGPLASLTLGNGTPRRGASPPATSPRRSRWTPPATGATPSPPMRSATSPRSPRPSSARPMSPWRTAPLPAPRFICRAPR